MSPRTGRPTSDPKNTSSHFRLSAQDIEMLEFCAKATGLTKTEIIRQGIREVYAKIKNSGNENPSK